VRIAIVGAGALGQIYGVRLAERNDVTYVVRPARVAETRSFRLESALPFGSAREQEAPKRADRIPDDADLAIVTVRFDTVAAPDADLARVLAAPKRTMVVVLSPVFAEQRADIERLVGHHVVPAMPGVSGYEDDRGVIRHWVPAVASTMIDDGTVRYGSKKDIEQNQAAHDDVSLRVELARALSKAGLPARLERDVESLNAATTTSFFPPIAAVAIAGDVAALVADADLVTLVLDASKECEALAAKLGKTAAWAGMLTKFLGPFTFKAGAALARRLAPEAVHFIDVHFGPKLREQHLLMGRHIVHLADRQGDSVPALRALCARLEETPARGSAK
jgi:ketopantoate reductase